MSAANFVMHTAHCFRNISLCKICNEPFPKSDLDTHIAEAHAKVKCAKCGDEIEHHDIEEHDVMNYILCFTNFVNITFY